jgi:hypothetical protein
MTRPPPESGTPFAPTSCSAHMSYVRRALKAVNIVRPRAWTGQANSGTLHVDVEGAVAHIYSRAKSTTVARATFPVLTHTGDAQFCVPELAIDAILQLPDGVVTFAFGQRDDRHVLRYVVNATSGETPTFSPGMTVANALPLRPWVDADEFVVAHLPAGILREALVRAKPFMSSGTTQIFDTSRPDWVAGDGNLFARDEVGGCYFHCDRFSGSHIAVDVTGMTSLVGLLKRSSGDVVVRRTATWTAVTNSLGESVLWLSHRGRRDWHDESSRAAQAVERGRRRPTHRNVDGGHEFAGRHTGVGHAADA